MRSLFPIGSNVVSRYNLFEKDLFRLNELLNGKIHCLELMGGEALLHPQLEDFIKITAKYVTGEKNLCTNGVLLSKLPDKIYKYVQKQIQQFA